MGTMTASSAALMYLFCQATSLVCLRPVSPLTKLAVMRPLNTGRRSCARVMLGRRRAIRMTALCSGTDWMISRETSSNERGRITAGNRRVVCHRAPPRKKS